MKWLLAATVKPRRNWAFVFVGLLSGVLLLADSKIGAQESAPRADRAEQLVAEALHRDIYGQRSERAKLLRQALTLAPQLAPARWHSGQLKTAGRWRSVHDVARYWSDDQRLIQYRQLRARHDDSIQGHVALARWCRRQKLADEARAHWHRVLNLQPNHYEAARSLHLETYNGQLLPTDVVRQLRDEEKQAAKAMSHWRPRLARLRRQFESGDHQQRRAVLDQLRTIREPAAIPPLDEVFSAGNANGERSGAKRENDERLYLELIAILGNFPQHAATESLVRHAIYAPFESVRGAAIKQLESRPLYATMPPLLDEFASPIQSTFTEARFPDGTLRMRHVLHRHDTKAHRYLYETKVIVPNPRGGLDLVAIESKRNRVRHLEKWITAKNVEAAARNERIKVVLYELTGEEIGTSPALAADWWQDYNERYDPEGRLPYTFTGRLSAFVTLSCFAKGTKVTTLTGPVAIETIQIGDRVLAQHPESGELLFKPVLSVTLRPPSPAIDIDVGTERITTTRGHPLWVSGDGWRMAKHLKSGQLLYALEGSVPISVAKECGDRPAYNLVVADFHNYFVGTAKILAHDNTPCQPSVAVVPGLATD